MLTLARASARIGQLDRAQGLLDELVRENLAWADVAIAVPIMEGWIAHGRGDPERAASALEQGCKAIDTLRAAQREREEGKLGEPPYFEVGAIQAAIVDAAALMIALGESERALGVILPLSNLFTPLQRMVASDPAFDPLRNHAETREAFVRWQDSAAKG